MSPVAGRNTLLVIVVLLAAALLAAALAPAAQADRLATRPPVLPAPRHEGTAVWDPRDLAATGCPGGCAYLVGGRDGSGGAYPDIIGYNPATGAVFTAAALPRPLKLAAAVYAGGIVYVLGGTDPSAGSPQASHQSAILRFDPVTRTVTDTGVALPHRLSAATGVWAPGQGCTATCAYAFGGANNDGPGGSGQSLGAIVRYDPLAGTAVLVGTMSPPRSHAAAVWDPARGAALVFGGHDLAGPTMSIDEILAFDPAANSLSRAATLPAGIAYGVASIDARCAYYVGGQGNAGLRDAVLGLDLATLAVGTMPSRLPTPRAHMAAAFAGNVTHVLGGWDGQLGLAAILSYEGQAAPDTCPGALSFTPAQPPPPPPPPPPPSPSDPGDRDGDGVRDAADNCPEDPNPDQADGDGDGAGDACTPPPPPLPSPPPRRVLPDRDGDRIPDDRDNCPDDANADQSDGDGDGAGDACQPPPPPPPPPADEDLDGVPDGADNCLRRLNADQADADGDGAGDVCDEAPWCPGSLPADCARTWPSAPPLSKARQADVPAAVGSWGLASAAATVIAAVAAVGVSLMDRRGRRRPPR